MKEKTADELYEIGFSTGLCGYPLCTRTLEILEDHSHKSQYESGWIQGITANMQKIFLK